MKKGERKLPVPVSRAGKLKKKVIDISVHIPDPGLLALINTNIKNYKSMIGRTYVGTKNKFDKELVFKDDGNLIDSVIFNIWELSNYCSRASFQAISKKNGALVAFDATNVFIKPNKIEKILNNSDVQNALHTLGRARFKVRLLPFFDTISEEALYLLNDSLEKHTNRSVSNGIHCSGPREISITTLRKLSELDNAVKFKKRMIIPFEILRQDFSKISEIRSSEAYRKLCMSWELQRPIIQVKNTMTTEMIRKVSTLGDILIQNKRL